MSFFGDGTNPEEFLGPDPTKNSVILRAYDISRGFAPMLRALVNVEGIWHTGIEVFGVEYFYGGGIQALPAREFELVNNLTAHHTVVLGATSKSPSDLEEQLQAVQHRFTEATYNILTFNCNHFSNEISHFLLGIDIPDKYLRQAEIISQHPFGAQAINLIQGLGLSNPVGPNAATRPSSQAGIPFQPSTGTVTHAHTSSDERIRAVEQSLDAAGDFGRTLRVVTSNGSPEAQKKCLEVLDTLAFNIFSKATVSKYRTVKEGNPAIQEAIVNHPGGTACLEALGFVQRTEASQRVYEFPTPNAHLLHRLLNARKLIRQVLECKFASSVSGQWSAT